MFCTLDRPGTGPGRIVLALLLLALPSLALAQARVLTLESALQAARDNNLSLPLRAGASTLPQANGARPACCQTRS